jgi:type II secretory pathway predicted ATPase ExeA
MYESYWGLSESPFRRTIDTRWFQDNDVHDEALARLFYLVEQGKRCGVLVGPAGTGKSFLLKVLVRQVSRTQRQVATVDLLGLSSDEMLTALACALRIPASASGSRGTLWRDLEDYFRGSHACRIQTVLVLDHLERAEDDCVRAIDRLLHVRGAGGEFLTVAVASRSHANAAILNEMADIRVELVPFDRRPTGIYVQNLLRRAGCVEQVFDEPALDVLYEQSRGVPRDVNRLCDLSLLAAMSAEQRRVDERIVLSASLELQARSESPADRSLAAMQF